MNTSFLSRTEAGQGRKLVRIADDVNVSDLSSAGIHGEYAENLAIVMDDDAGLPVDLRKASDGILWHEFLSRLHKEARDVFRPMNRIRYGIRLPASIGVEHDIFGEKRKQSLHIAVRGRFDKLLQQPLLIVRRDIETRPVVHGVLLCAAEDLPAVHFTLFKNFGDFGVIVVKHFTKKKDGALDRRQALQKHQKRHRQRLIDFQDGRRFNRSFCEQWFREPLAEVYLPLYTRGLQLV